MRRDMLPSITVDNIDFSSVCRQPSAVGISETKYRADKLARPVPLLSLVAGFLPLVGYTKIYSCLIPDRYSTSVRGCESTYLGLCI